MKKLIKAVIPLTLIAVFFVFTGQQKTVDQMYVGANYVDLDSTDSGTIYCHLSEGMARFDTTAFRGIQKVNSDGDICFVMRVDSVTANITKDSLTWQIDTMTWDGRILETFYVDMSNTGTDAVSTSAISAGNSWTPDNRTTVTTEAYWVDLSAQFSPCFGFKHTVGITDDDGTDGRATVYIYPIVVK